MAGDPRPGRLEAARTGGSGLTTGPAGQRNHARIVPSLRPGSAGIPGFVEVVLGWCHYQAMQPPSGSNAPQLISDEDLQRVRLDKVTPHNAPITLADYDPGWPVLFAREAARIRAALGGRAVQVEHVGSTSVPVGFHNLVIAFELRLGGYSSRRWSCGPLVLVDQPTEDLPALYPRRR